MLQTASVRRNSSSSTGSANVSSRIDLLESLSDDLIQTHVLPLLDPSSISQLMQASTLLYRLITSSHCAHRRLVEDFGHFFEVIDKAQDGRPSSSSSLLELPHSSSWHQIYNKLEIFKYNIRHDLKTEFQLDLDSDTNDNGVDGVNENQDPTSEALSNPSVYRHSLDDELIKAAASADGRIIATCSRAGLIEVHFIPAPVTSLNRTSIKSSQLSGSTGRNKGEASAQLKTRLLWNRRFAVPSLLESDNSDDLTLATEAMVSLAYGYGDNQSSSLPLNACNDNPESLINAKTSARMYIKIIVLDDYVIVLSEVHGLLAFDLMTGDIKSFLVEGIPIEGDRCAYVSSILSSSWISSCPRNNQLIMVSNWCLYAWNTDTFQLCYKISALENCIQIGFKSAMSTLDVAQTPPTTGVRSVALDYGFDADCHNPIEKSLTSSVTPFVMNPSEGSFKSYQMAMLHCGFAHPPASNDLASDQLPQHLRVPHFRDLVVYSRISCDIQIFDASNGKFRGHLLHVSGNIKTISQRRHPQNASEYYLVSMTIDGSISIWSSLLSFQCIGSINLCSPWLFDVCFAKDSLCILRERRQAGGTENGVGIICEDENCPYRSPRVSDTLIDIYKFPPNVFNSVSQDSDSLFSKRQFHYTPENNSAHSNGTSPLLLMHSLQFPLPPSRSFQINADSCSLFPLFADVLHVASEYRPMWEAPVRSQNLWLHGRAHNVPQRISAASTGGRHRTFRSGVPRIRRGADWTADRSHTKIHSEYFNIQSVFNDAEPVDGQRVIAEPCLCYRRLSASDCHTLARIKTPGIAFYICLKKRKLIVESHWVKQ